MNRVSGHRLVALLVLAATLARLLPHPGNVTPIGALALFSGAYVGGRAFWLVPLAALWIGDLVDGLYATSVLAAVYAGTVASALVGRALLRHNDSTQRIALAVIGGALTFWLISNLGNWIAFRPPTVAGLIACYVDGLPYLTRSLFGDALYATLLFGALKLIRRRSAEPARA